MKIPINKQAEQKKREFDWSQQNFCTHILRKRKMFGRRIERFRRGIGKVKLPQVGVVCWRWGDEGCGSGWRAAHLFLGAWAVRGGVTGRPELTPLYWYLAFFSDGFRIWERKESVWMYCESTMHVCVCVCVWMITHLKRAHEWLIHTHHSTGVVKLPAVVWRWEQSDQLPLCKELITIFNHLRNTTHSLKLKHNLHIEDCLNHNNSKLTWIVDPDWLKWIGTWCALQIRSRSWRLRNLLTTSAPKVNETPRSFSPHPWTSLSGSDHQQITQQPCETKRQRICIWDNISFLQNVLVV